MTKHKQQLIDVKAKLVKSLDQLEHSFNKVMTLPSNPKLIDNESLETWESFSVRFNRVAEMFLFKYLKAFVKSNDPGFDGSFREFLKYAKKLGLIENIDGWTKVRELRNIEEYESSDDDFEYYLEQLRAQCPRLLCIREKFTLQ